MKKVVSIVLSLVMIFAVNALAFTASAEVVSPNKGSIGEVYGKVNGKKDGAVKVIPDENDDRKFTFKYTGKGKVVGWDIENMVEGKDYEIVSETDDSITIVVSDDYSGDVVANATVEFEGSGTKTVSSDTSRTSPKTGAMTAAGVAAMGVGFAVLGALKKKED